MNCELTEKVSALVDGELPEAESRELTKHVQSCEECSRAREDFLFMRRQIKGLAVDEQTATPLRTNFLRRRIAIPVPVFALAILALAGLFAVLFVSMPNGPENSVKISRPDETKTSSSSLARFDRGGKAQIYKEVRR
ncbi:MAG: zf-HC2 domain-containing protein [Acidobacteriota bacterium]|nr:zf-HC2 domain-containing protein [Acidobacteriota bacterium]